MAKDKPLAVYGPKAMKAEGDELRSLELMKKQVEKDRAKERAKMPSAIARGAKANAEMASKRSGPEYKNRPSPRDVFPTEWVPGMAEYYSQGRHNMPKDVRDSVIARAKNMKGHDELTKKAEKEIKAEKLRKKASAPGASTYDKVRAKVNKVTGLAKGGMASKRADGCAMKGKTKGKMV